MKYVAKKVKDVTKNKSYVFKPISQEELVEKVRAEKRPALLDLIGQKESNGHYNAYYGNATNKEVDFTKMSINQVRRWQDEFVANGSKSSAVGKYQIIRKTMDSLIKEMGLNGSEMFDQDLQDAMALKLADGRGYSKWKNGKLSDEQFANNLAKEWASFPVVTGPKAGMSYYAGDGLNKALISPDQVFSALNQEKENGTT